MIVDSETDQLYLADTLHQKIPSFATELVNLLNRHQISPKSIPGTRDIWCRDYMPVQVSASKMVGFSFSPSYLKDEPYSHTITDNREVCRKMGLNPLYSDIVLDGGNVVKAHNKVIVTDIIYKENPNYSRKELRQKLAEVLEVEHVVVIPRQPYDFTGHADGMVRFLDNDTVLVNDFQFENTTFQDRLLKTLKKHRLNIEVLPYGFEYEKAKAGHETAQGIYINYLHIGNLIVLPMFWLLPDEEVYKRISQLYPRATIETINANRAAQHGGVLNCLTWTIKAS